MIYVKDTEYKKCGNQNFMFALFKCNNCGIEKEYVKTKIIRRPELICKACTIKNHGNKIKTHGDSQNNTLYYVYKNMMARCYSVKVKNYYRYGGRGIRVCDEWVNGYENFRSWALSNGYEYVGKNKGDSMSIDRINVDGNYEPSNCQFIKNRINSSKDSIRFSYSDSIAVKSIKVYFGFSNSKIGKLFNCGSTLISNTINNKIKLKGK